MSAGTSSEIEGALHAVLKTMAVLKQTKDAIDAAKEVTAAHHADRIERLELKGAKKRNPILLSLLLAVVALWYSRGQPVLVVWRLSFALCFLSSFWTYFLTKTMGFHVFFYNLFGILLAFCAHTVLNPSIGVLIVHFTSQFATLLLGYALAEHRQRVGAEWSAAVVPVMSDEEEAGLRVLRIVAGILISVPTLAFMAWVAWMLWHSADYPIEELMTMILMALSAVSFFGIFFVAMLQLRGRLISPLGFSFVTIYFAVVFVLHIAFCSCLGDVAAMVITWFGSLALTGFFGYCLSVFTTLKLIRRTRAFVELERKRR